MPEGYSYTPLSMVLRVCERFGMDPTKLIGVHGAAWDEVVAAHLIEHETIRMQEDTAKFRALLDAIVAAAKAVTR